MVLTWMFAITTGTRLSNLQESKQEEEKLKDVMENSIGML